MIISAGRIIGISDNHPRHVAATALLRELGVTGDGQLRQILVDRGVAARPMKTEDSSE